MEVYKVFMDWKIIYGKDTNSPKLIYTVSATLIKIQETFF